MTWLTGWSKRRKLTVDGSKISGNLTNFPLMVCISSGTGLTDSDLTDVFDELSPYTAPTTSGLMHEYTMDSVSGATVYDTCFSGSNSVTITAGYPVVGKIGNAMGFGSVASTVRYGLLTTGTSAWRTVSFWTKRYDLANTVNFFMASASTALLACQPTGSSNYLYTYASSTQYNSNLAITDTNWHHVVAVLENATTLRYYLDGVAATTTCTWSTSYSVNYIGRSSTSSAQEVPYMDHIRFYDRALSQTEITQLFNEGINSNNTKIAIATSDAVQCPVEIEYWNYVTQTAYLWTKVPTLTSGVSTELYLYYDSTHADNSGYVGETTSISATNVWDSNFLGVWHMNQSPFSTEFVKDSTINTRHMSPTDMTGLELYNGSVGRTIDFDGASDYLTCPSTPSVPSSWTFEGFVKPDTTGSTKVIVNIVGSALGMCDATPKWCVVYNNDAQYKAHAVVTGSYIYIVGVKDGSNYYIYEDGVEYHESVVNTSWSLSGLKIGQGYSTNRFDGRIDEVRASQVARSAAWIQASYYSVKDDLIMVGSLEDNPPSPTPSPDLDWLEGWSKRIPIAFDGSKIEGDLTNFPVLVVLSSGTGRNDADLTPVFDELSSYSTVSGVTWSPTDIGASITLSNGNLTGTRTTSASWYAVRGQVMYKSSGKWYWEVTVSSGGDGYDIIGIGTAAENLTYPGSSTNGYGYQGLNGRKYYGGAYTSWGSTFGVGDTIGVALDLDEGKIWWSKNGVWQVSGDPGAGSNPAYTEIAGTFYPMVGMYSLNNQVTARFTPASFLHTTPSGFLPFANTFADNTKKIAITTSDNIQCYVEIEDWNWANEKAYLWTKVPTLISGGNTQLYLYYDVTQADNSTYVGAVGSSPARQVWNNGFVGVWHLNENPAGGSSAIINSVKGEWYGTSGGSMTFSDRVTGKVYKGIDFDGSNDYISCGDIEDITSRITMEGVYKSNNRANWEMLMCKGAAYPNDLWGLGYMSTDNNVSAHVNLTTDGRQVAALTSGAPEIDFAYLAGRFDGTYIDVFINDTKGTSPYNSGGDTIKTDANNLYFGSRAGTDNVWLKGVLDEVRISNVSRSDAWLKATYYTIFDDLVSYESIETEPHYYYDGYVKEYGLPVSRTVRLYRRDTGILMDSTVSDTDGYYYLTTTLSGEHFVVAFDDDIGDVFNALVADRLEPRGIE